MIARTALLYLLIFAGVLLALDAGAYAFVQREYVSLLGPALGTPEGAVALSSAMRRVLVTIATIDLPLLVLVGAASYALARAAIAPIAAARERERVFAADAAHELRSPLATIASIAQAARAGATPQDRDVFEAIASHALEASATVADLLTLARDPGRSVLQCEPVDLAAVVAHAAQDAAGGARARGIALESAPVSAIVDGDERRLRELARNLLENAIRYAGSAVRIGSERNGRTCRIVVEDDGAGIPPDERERIFERFYRRTQDATGTGLGLAIVAWIAHAHDGTVTVDTAPAGGARFVATLPARADR
ncbi:MAG TPA: HAMP domain-containing sensor histidine kinase [Candidatus Baltobacteraceae bacterium]|nr:HAMP domain-containing sensor histidine kinase [Candidatus Baltobacteraceae bacterium]